MSTQTENLHLKKPSYSDSIDVADLNGNADILDAFAGAVSAALAAKQDTMTFDTVPTENSTNPVTSGGVYPVAAKAVDEGAKNKAKWTGITQTINNVVFTVSDDHVVVTLSSGTTATARSQVGLALEDFDKLPAGKYVISGAPTMTSGGLYVWDNTAAARVSQSVRTSGGGVEFDFTPVTGHSYCITIDISNGYAVTTLDFCPMICTKAAWDVSQKYVPYAPTNRELYEMILALQSGGNRSLSMRTAEAEPEEKEVETDAGNPDQNQR